MSIYITLKPNVWYYIGISVNPKRKTVKVLVSR